MLRVLAEEFPDGRESFAKPFRVRAVGYSYADLNSHYAEFIGAALSGGGKHVATYIDVLTNRLTAGAEDDNHAAQIRAALAKSRIPVDMYEVRTEGRLVRLADLNQRIRPMVAGLRVTRLLSPSNFVNCTMGPIVVRNGELGVLINSHCTPSTNPDFTIWYQSQAGASNDRIGVETYEAGLSDCTSQYDTLPGVPSGATFGCRSADAVWVKLDPGVTGASSVKKGYIARTTTGLTIAPTPWRVAGALLSVVGSNVQKTGRVTGTTAGSIIAQCVDEFIPLPAGVSFVVEQCQTRASVFASSGDSGSPIYQQFSLFGADAVAIEGMLASGIGCTPQGTNCTAISYAPWSNLLTHIGLASWTAFLP